MLDRFGSHCETLTGAKAFLIFFFVFFFTLPLFAQQVDTAWVRRYNGSANIGDEAHAIAVDDSGNVYVTGWSAGAGTGQDYATIKYYPNGDTAWIRRYEGPGNGEDRATALSIDGSGYIYVTGFSWGSGTLSDYATIKYYPNGDTAWMRRYNGAMNYYDEATDIAVDSSGNVYVTGWSWDDGPGSDYATIKYLPNGDIAWVRGYPQGMAFAIAVDSSGNIYVTGGCEGIPIYNHDYVTIKYYPNGDTAWARRYNGSGDTSDVARSIAVDGSDNVYVTGRSWGSGTGSDYATIKYKPDGDTAWVRRYNGSGNGDDEPFAIVADGSHNVYVTGRCWNGGSNDWATIKYFPNGDTAWLRTYDGNWDDGARAIAVDDSGNVYVTGSSWRSGTTWDYLTIKYDPNGNKRWAITYDGPANAGDYAQAIAVGGLNNVYVTGVSAGSGTDYDYATIKYWQNFPPNSYSLISPLNADSIKTPVSFNWQTSIDPDLNDTVRYDLYLSRSADFTPDSIVYVGLLDTTYRDSIDFTDTSDLKLWYWKAKAYDKWGATRWSDESWSFYVYLCGDCNGDGKINVADVVYAINYLFKGGPVLKPLIAGDVNCDGKVTVADVVYTINYLFKGGPKPCQSCP